MPRSFYGVLEMNDFTKEELEEIVESFDWIESETSWDWKHPLRNKIQSMIDNYCDHEFNENIGGFCWKCTKCGAKIGDETQ